MGLAGSKIGKHASEKDFQEGSIPSTPILAPKVIKQEDLDPRSPSMHISRTPLQLLSAASLKLEEFKENESTNEQTPAKVLLGIDPRSPTVEFKRTPIIVTASESDTLEKIHNKNLDRVKRSFISTPPNSTSKKEKIPSHIPPKLLESSPIKARSDSIKRKSFVGLLETNIDFTETDLDAVIREKNKTKETFPIANELATPSHKQISSIIDTESMDPRSPTTEFIRTPIQIIKKISNLDISSSDDVESRSTCPEKDIRQSGVVEELEDHKIVEKCVQEICESVHLPKMETRETLRSTTDVHENIAPTELPISVPPTTAEFDIEEREIHDEQVTTEPPIEIKSAPITPPTADGKLKALQKETKSAPVTPPVVNLTADIKEFDKKLTNLIYHDEDVVICPRKVKLKDYDSRSPLRNLNSIETEKKKSAQKQKSNEKSRRSEYAVSKIPVFKEKGKMVEVQCENTPPRNVEKRKVRTRKSHWDNADATLII